MTYNTRRVHDLIFAEIAKHDNLKEVKVMWVSAADMLRTEGILEGIQKGKLEGKLEGKVEMLVKLVDSKYKDEELASELRVVSNIKLIDRLYALALKWESANDFKKRYEKLMEKYV